MQNLIKETGLTNKEFAEYYEIPYNTVLQWAKGIRKAPKYITKLIKENRNLKTNGIQLKIEETEPINEKNYFIRIRHVESQTTIYTTNTDYENYKNFEKGYYYNEYVKNSKGYVAEYFLLKEIN